LSVSKVQHGCIDCLALMISVELQAEESITDSMPDRVAVIGKKGIIELNDMIWYDDFKYRNANR